MSFPAQSPLLVATGAIGLIFGSFVTALSYRLPRGESIARGRSRCPACGHVLAAADLVPVASWIVNRGACRHCGAKVSWRYPAIELVTMAVCVVSALVATDLRSFALLLFMAPVMMALAVIDLEHKRLPNVLVGILAALALAWRWSGDQNLTAALITGATALVLGVSLDWLSRRLLGVAGLGMGDTKLFALAGLALAPPVYLLFALMAGGFGVAWGLVWRIRDGMRQFPFSPVILASFWLALSFGDTALRGLLNFLSG